MPNLCECCGHRLGPDGTDVYGDICEVCGWEVDTLNSADAGDYDAEYPVGWSAANHTTLAFHKAAWEMIAWMRARPESDVMEDHLTLGHGTQRCSVTLTIQPQEFCDEMHRIGRLIAGYKHDEANAACEAAIKRWGSQPDIIRAQTLNGFMGGEAEATNPEPVENFSAESPLATCVRCRKVTGTPERHETFCSQGH